MVGDNAPWGIGRPTKDGLGMSISVYVLLPMGGAESKGGISTASYVLGTGMNKNSLAMGNVVTGGTLVGHGGSLSLVGVGSDALVADSNVGSLTIVGASLSGG